MNYELLILPRVKDDLFEAAVYIDTEAGGVARAERFITAVQEATNSLIVWPGPLIKQELSINVAGGRVIRRLNIPGFTMWTLLYEVSGSQVIILVLAGAAQITETFLAELPPSDHS